LFRCSLLFGRFFSVKHLLFHELLLGYYQQTHLAVRR